MKPGEAIVYKDKTGYWVAKANDNGNLLGGFHDSELAAYKAANRLGYIVR